MRDTSIEYYQRLWDRARLSAWAEERRGRVLQKWEANRREYEAVRLAPALWIFAIHMMEAGGNLQRQILNGQYWKNPTTIVPVGRGPWNSWRASALAALQGYRNARRWSIPDMLRRAENWNGMGYAMRGLDSPYLVSGCDIDGDGRDERHQVGKYTSDGWYDPAAVSQQVGVIAILKLVQAQDPQAFSPVAVRSGAPPQIYYDRRGENRVEAVEVHQVALNAITDGRLVVDGWAGHRTSQGHRRAFGAYLKGDPRGES